jgi:hypothetical protein
MSGQAVQRADISAITNACPCTVTTDEAHGFSSESFVRITDLNGMIPIHRGMTQINNQRWEIVVTSTTQFTLRDPITKEDVNSTGYTPYVSGGSCNVVATEYFYEA